MPDKKYSLLHSPSSKTEANTAAPSFVARHVDAIDWVLRLSIVLGLISLGAYAVLQTQITVWQMWIDVVGILTAMICTIISRRYLRRGNLEVAGYWTLAAILCAFGIGEFGWIDSSPLGALIAPALILLVAYLIRPRRWYIWIASAIGFVVFVATLDRWSPLPRVPIETIPALTLVFTVPGVVLFLALLARTLSAFRIGTIRTRLLIAFVAGTLILVVTATGISSVVSVTNAQAGQLQQLDAIATLKANELKYWARDLLNVLNSEILIDQQTGSNSIHAILNNPANSSAYQQGASQLGQRFDIAVQLQKHFEELLLLDDAGNILVASHPTHIGRSAVNQIFFRESRSQPSVISPMYVSVLGAYGVMAAVPIFDANHELIGMLAGHAASGGLDEILADPAGLGETGDTFLIDESFRLLNTPRLGIVGGYVRTQAAQDVLHNQANGQGSYAGYRNTQVSGVYHWIPELRTALIVEQDQSEANRASTIILTVSSIVAVVITLLAVGVSLVLTRSIAGPLTRLAATAEQISGGDLAATASIEREDEVGQVARTFNVMTDQLRSLIGSLESRVKMRTEQLRASAEVGHAAVSSLDTGQLLAEVVNLITERFGFYYAAVFTLDASGQSAVLHEATGEAGHLLKERGHHLEVGGQSMVGTAIAQRKARIALDVGTEAVRFANPLLPYTRSEIALPLIVGNQVLGALDVQSDKEAAFDEESAIVLQAMADQIAVALNNAALFAESHRVALQSRTLYQASREVGRGETDINLTIKAVMHLVEQQLDYIQWWVVMLDERREVLHPLGTSGQSIRVADQPDGPAVRSALYGESITVNDPEHDPHLLGLPPQRRAGIGKFVSVPIIVQEKSIGALMLGRNLDGTNMTEADLDVANSLASLAAFAIENRRLHEQTQQALAELDRANRRLTGESWSAFARKRSQGMLWVSTTDRDQQTALPEVGDALASGQIATRLLNGDGQLGVAVPIALRDTTIGALRLVVPQSQYTDELRSTLESIAGHIAQAAENARLLDETQARFARERVLSDATNKLRRKTEVEEILQTAADELAHYLRASAIQVRLSPTASDTHKSGESG